MNPVPRLAGGLIVSCQAPEGSPLREPAHMAAMARAAELAGASGIRAQGVDDVRAIKSATSLPVIGIRKRKVAGFEVFITPGVHDAHALIEAGADLIAADLTPRPRPDGQTADEMVAFLREAGVPLMADVGDAEQARFARDLGADILAPTLAPPLRDPAGGVRPDLDLLAEIVHLAQGVPVIAEGSYARPLHLRQALDLGAHAVVVGRAITDPLALARDFASAAEGFRDAR